MPVQKIKFAAIFHTFMQVRMKLCQSKQVDLLFSESLLRIFTLRSAALTSIPLLPSLLCPFFAIKLFMRSEVSPAYGVFISQLIRYARACSSYECFILRAARLSSKLLRQGYVIGRLKSSLRKFYGRYGDLIKHYEVSLSQMLHDILGHDHIQ